ncbi:MAG TPA: preprotein translocase subunit SecA [Candidatus Absconditabacterales bacterium]|nr:preprotein translocase subunit SecA [Candidatus Absconditabacterales bacterium]
MINRIMSVLTGDYNAKEIKKLAPLVQRIYHFDKEYTSLSDSEIKALTEKFKARIQAGETTDDILPEAFAALIQACKRMQGEEFEVKGQLLKWNMVPYESQLIGGMILHQGKISEMKTGEGKTLVATLPAYLNALEGKGVHVVTVNDYLASRDSEWMAHLFNWLGLSVGNVTKSTPLANRRAEYEKDITYVENSELGFDYLRDNLTRSISQRNVTWRPLHYAIVDEVDSIFIDEARTPLIISDPYEETTDKYVFYANLVKRLTPATGKKKVSQGFLKELISDEKQTVEENGDYYVDEKTKTTSLTSAGIAKLEQWLKVENLYRDLGYQEIHHIESALKAFSCYHKDKEYIIVNGEILIVDEHTGRTMPGRRFSDGLHQAIEAKENVAIQKESRTLATVTYQNFFKNYKKLSGMTGTATTEGEEFEKIYNLAVIAIPTNKPVIRVDKNDKVFFNQTAKRNAVMSAIKFHHEMGQPILIGTSSIATSEFVSSLLTKSNIIHSVLNAKYHEQEAKIVSNAGKEKSIVVATNMAGRGTDIKLSPELNPKIASNYAKRIAQQLKGNTFSSTAPAGVIAYLYSKDETELTLEAIKNEFSLTDDQIRQAEKNWTTAGDIELKILFNSKKKSNDTVYATIHVKPAQSNPDMIEKDFHYGLFILGTEKHESRRIDNQLRGRAGRQGDAGISVFFVSLDDEIMRKMGGERIQGIASMLLSKKELEELELTQKQFTNSIERAQKQMEGWHFSIRKHLFEYDSVINRQRQRMYGKRDDILMRAEAVDEETRKQFVADSIVEIKGFIADVTKKILLDYTALSYSTEELTNTIEKEFGLTLSASDIEKTKNLDELQTYLIDEVRAYFTAQFSTLELNQQIDLIKNVYLTIIDKYRIDHIDDMQNLRDQVGLYGYAQVDPLIIYKKEAFEKFENLLNNIKQHTISTLLKTDFSLLKQSHLPANQITMEDNSLINELMHQINPDLQEMPIYQPQKLLQNSTHSDDAVEIIDLNQKSNFQTIPPENKKIRPNDPCRCGSGKKFKKCHGAK